MAYNCRVSAYDVRGALSRAEGVLTLLNATGYLSSGRSEWPDLYIWNAVWNVQAWDRLSLRRVWQAVSSALANLNLSIMFSIKYPL